MKTSIGLNLINYTDKQTVANIKETNNSYRLQTDVRTDLCYKKALLPLKKYVNIFLDGQLCTAT